MGKYWSLNIDLLWVIVLPLSINIDVNIKNKAPNNDLHLYQNHLNKMTSLQKFYFPGHYSFIAKIKLSSMVCKRKV